MSYSEDHIVLAAEYVLGTLDAEERAQVDTMMSVDMDFRSMVESWESKLGELNVMVGSVEPPPGLWDKIRVAAQLSSPQLPLTLPEIPAPPPPAPVIVEPDPAIHANVIALSRQTKRWRHFAAAATAVAAALA